MNTEFEIPIPFALSFHGLVLVALLISFWKLLRIKDRNYGFYMVAILHLCYIGYPIMNIISIHWVYFEGWNKPPTPIMGSLAVVFYVFSIHWTSANALFTYLLTKSILAGKSFPFKKFLWTVFAISAFVTALFPVA